MLQNLRDQSGNWIFKLLLITIAASFFIFGIGDMVRGIFSHRPIAVVGAKDIAMEELDAEIRHDFRRIQQRQSNVTLQDLLRLGFIDQILERIINRTVLTQEMDRLQLTASENVIRSNIKSMEPFLENGQFDHTKFQSILKNANLNQKNLVNDMRRQIIERQYFLSFTQAGVQSKYYRDLLTDAMLQKRKFSIINVIADKMKIDKNPTNQEIAEFFDAHKTNYTIPESRDIQLVELDLKKLSHSIKVSDKDLKEAYQDKKHLYFTPETRHVKKLILSTEANAQAALSLFKNKKDVAHITKAVKGTKVTDLGEITKNILPNADQDTVFDIKKGEHSGIIQEKNKFVIYQVLSITKEEQQSFEQIKAQLLNTVRLERFQTDYKILKDKIEDEIAGGNTLKATAITLNLPLITITKVSKDGAALNNQEYNALKDLKGQILEQAFQLEEGNTSPVLEVTLERSFILSVKKTTAEHVPAFDAVKEKVTNDALSYLKRQKAAEVAQKIAQETKDSATFSKLAEKNKMTITRDHVYSRKSLIDNAELKEQMMADSIERAFSVPLNQAIVGRSKDGFVVIMPEKDLPISADNSEKEVLVKRMDEIMNESMIDLLINGMKQHHPITIKTDNLKTFISMITKSEG